MAYTRKESQSNDWKAVKDMTGFSVIGTKDRFSISFEVCEGMRIGFNGCRVVSGKNGEFISFPAWKDKSGNYHDYCYITLTPEEVSKIIKALD